MSPGESHESGTLKLNVSPCQQKSSSGKFTVGNWDQFNELWGFDEDEEDTFTEDIRRASSPSPSPSLEVRVVNSSEGDEWLELEHEDADSSSYQPGSLAPQIETSPSDTSSSNSESEAYSDLSEEQREQERSYAQRLLVNRALHPERRASLLPYRKTIIFKPTPLKLQPKDRQDQAGASQCPACGSNIFRMISEQLCLPCTMDKVRSAIEALESQAQLNEDEYIEANRRISERKCAIEDENPDDYMENTEWLDLRSEHVEFSEERVERGAGLRDRLAELEAQINQYEEWLQEDLAKFR